MEPWDHAIISRHSEVPLVCVAPGSVRVMHAMAPFSRDPINRTRAHLLVLVVLPFRTAIDRSSFFLILSSRYLLKKGFLLSYIWTDRGYQYLHVSVDSCQLQFRRCLS